MYELAAEAKVRPMHKIVDSDQDDSVLHEHDLTIRFHFRLKVSQTKAHFLPSREIEDIIQNCVQRYDGINLTDLPEFQGTMVLIEDFARVLYGIVEEKTEKLEMDIYRVEIIDNVSLLRTSYVK